MARRIPRQSLAAVALGGLLLALSGRIAHGAEPVRIRYSFDDGLAATGPDTFTVFRNAKGSVQLSTAFHVSGYHSIMAGSGAEALKRLDQIRADAIITDLMMPVMGGAELVRRIRADPRMKAIPIIVLTGSGREKALEELGDAARHVNAVLVKPVKLSDLQRALEAALAEA